MGRDLRRDIEYSRPRCFVVEYGEDMKTMARTARFLACGIFLVVAEAAAQGPLQSSDLLKMRSVTAVEVSPDGARAAYVVENNDGTGRPYGTTLG
jgi:hypothetical protein